MNPYENLANAIIMQAVKDYRRAVKGLAKNPNNSTAVHTKSEVERFFRSAWFNTLTNLNPEKLLRDLKAEVAV